MKKLCYILLFMCITNRYAFADKKCEKPIKLTYEAQLVNHNEFLYENKYNFEESQKGFDKDPLNRNSGNGVGYECDGVNSKSCTTGDLVHLNAGHYFEKKEISNAKWYKCDTNGGDSWEEYTPDTENNCVKHGWPEISVGGCLKIVNGLSCKIFDLDQCSNFKPDPNGTQFNLRCSENKQFKCVPVTCKDGYKIDDKKCVEKNTEQFEQNNGQEKTINDSNDGAKNNQKNQTTSTTRNGSQQNVSFFKCPNNELNDWGQKYTNNTEIIRLINDIQTKCEKNEFNSQNEYDVAVNEIKTSIDRIEKEAKVNELSKVLSGIQAKFTTSHWTDEEGNFNKKRLVSDSVAATVLGTAGGLITSNVIKKKQVEKGFDALQCTVGGQSVATWGDEFIVGVK